MTPDAGQDPRDRRTPQGVTIPSVDADIDACQEIALDQAGPAQPVLRRHRQEADGGGRPLGPYLWAKNITVTGSTVTKFEFDQFSGYLSYTQMAVNNNATVPS